MGFENFLIKVRAHWVAVLLLTLLIGAGLLLVGFLLTAGGSLGGMRMSESLESANYGRYDGSAQKSYDSYYPGMPSPTTGGFAPNEQERKVERTASLVSEVERGAFDDAQSRLEAAVQSHKGFILSQNVNKYGRADTRTGYYSIKIPVGAYNETIAQLKQIGDVETFQESAQDVTGQYTDTRIEFASEKARLERYQALYQGYGALSDRLQLEDRVFDQQRRIEYLQQSLQGTDERVDYSTVSVTLREEEPTWAQIGFVKLRDLVTMFVTSLKALLYTLAAVLPWALLAGLVWLVVWIVRRK